MQPTSIVDRSGARVPVPGASHPRYFALQQLTDEHALIDRGLDVLEGMAVRTVHGFPPNAEAVAALVDWFRGFADGCHHVKEEGVLYATLAESGLSRTSGPLGVALADHEEGRRLLGQIEQAPQERLLAVNAHVRVLQTRDEHEEVVRPEGERAVGRIEIRAQLAAAGGGAEQLAHATEEVQNLDTQ